MNPKLNSTVSVVKINTEILEFFLTNIRQQVRLRVKDDLILRIVLSLDGEKPIEEIAKTFDVPLDALNKLLDFLRFKGILDNVEPKDHFDEYDSYRRVIHFLSEYSHSHAHLLKMWRAIRNATVLVVGVGAVGSWVACNLVQSGVKRLILMDADVVEGSNLHRQFGYGEADIGKYKVDVLAKRLSAFSQELEIVKVPVFLNETALNQFNDIDLDLIVNCADKPTVDQTSLWIGEYAMRRRIPHIIGGGYTLHLSLIGQTVLPGRSACLKCFQHALEEENKIDSKRVKKLQVRDRKVGSFGSMCALIASMIGMEAIKVLSREILPSNLNRRGEFDIHNMELRYKVYNRREDCEWCGKNGKYFRS